MQSVQTVLSISVYCSWTREGASS